MNIFFWRKEEPIDVMRELLEIAVKSGRRCAYDLKHSIGHNSPEFEKILSDRADHWLTIFNSAQDMKNYRIRMHRSIEKLEDEVERLSVLCRKNGIDPENPDGVPF